MYPVSEAYRAAMHLPVHRFGVSGAVGDEPFTTDDLLGFSVQNQCSDGSSLRIGQVYVGELRATFTADFRDRLGRYAWTGKTITATALRDVAGLNAAAPVWEGVPLGVYTIPSDGVTFTADGVEVTAYDAMAKLDNAQAYNPRGLLPYDFALRFANRAHVELGQSAEEFAAMPNGREKIYLRDGYEGKTARDVFAWLGEVLGCFCTAGRDGKIYFRPYSRQVVDTLDPEHRWQGCRFAGYETRYSQVQVWNVADEEEYFAYTGGEDYLRYDLGENPLLQEGGKAVIEARLHNILTALLQVAYVPFEAAAVGDPAYDLGDVMRFPRGIGDASRLFCITQHSWTLNGEYRMSGSGENPELWEAKSRAEKSAEDKEAESKVADDKPLYARNAEQVVIADRMEDTVLSIDFSTGAGTHIEARATIIMLVETTETGDSASGWTCGDAVAQVSYYIDGVKQSDQHPTESYQDGGRVLTLVYDFDCPAGYEHTFSIGIFMSGGKITVDAGEAVVSLSGIGAGAVPEDYPEDPSGLAYIRVDNLPDKREYLIGEILDYTGLSVTAVYYDGTETDVTALCTCTPADGSTAPEEPAPLLVDVAYTEGGETYKAAFDLNVLGLSRIDVTHLPNKTNYYVGEQLDMTGLMVTAFFTDGTSRDITAECTTVPEDGYTVVTAGYIIVEVRYHDKPAAQFELTAESGVVSAEITSYPPETSYYLGQYTDYSGLVVTATMWDGTEKNITADCTISPPEGTLITDEGTILVTVSFADTLLGTFDLTAEAGAVIASGDWWTLYETGLLDIYCVGDMPAYSSSELPWIGNIDRITSVTIRDSVTSIGNRAFYACTNLTDVTIPDSVTSIGYSAFESCTNLTNVTIPDGVTSIGNRAFASCTSLTSVAIPDGVTSIKSSTFYACRNLTDVTIPDSVTSIGNDAFQYCTNLKNITIPDSVTSIGNDVFYFCGNLKDITIPDSVTSIGNYAFRDCGLKSVEIPGSVKSLGTDVFRGCSGLVSALIQDGVEKIANSMFYDCINLTNITIPGSVTIIGGNAFYNCRKLKDITIPDSVTSIVYGAFQSCTNLTNITIPDSVTSIGYSAFASCTSLTSVAIPYGVTEIQYETFRDCANLTDVTIPDSVTSIGNRAFYACRKLTDITIPDSVTSIGVAAFIACGLKSVEIPGSVKSFGNDVFTNCTGLVSALIQDGVETIGGGAFANCTNLTDITIPDSVTSIGYNAFQNCNNLKDVYYAGMQEQWQAISIGTGNEPLTSATIHYNSTGPEG